MEHLSVAIADDNQRILDMLDDIIQTDKELDLVGKAKNGEETCDRGGMEPRKIGYA